MCVFVYINVSVYRYLFFNILSSQRKLLLKNIENSKKKIIKYIKDIAHLCGFPAVAADICTSTITWYKNLKDYLRRSPCFFPACFPHESS